jgi:hypothetical protein
MQHERKRFDVCCNFCFTATFAAQIIPETVDQELFGSLLVNSTDVMNNYSEKMNDDKYAGFPETMAAICDRYVHATTDCVVALDFGEIDYAGLTTDLMAEAPEESYVWDEAEVKCLFYNVWQAMRQKFCHNVVILTPENIVALSETYLLHSKFASPMHDEQAMGHDLAFKMWDKHVLPDLVSMRHSRKDHNLCCVCSTRNRTTI